jgi:uncharacterized membrane protein YfcA
VITDPLFYAVAIVAVTTLGLSKGGFSGLGALAVPLLTLVIPPLQALAILLPILLAQDILTIWAYRKTWSGRVLAVMIPGQILGAAIAWMIAAYVSDAYVRIAVGAIAVFFTVNYWRNRNKPREPQTPPKAAGVFWGTIAGITGFLAHAGQPPFQMYVLPQRLPKEVLVGTLAIFFATSNLLKIYPYFALGQLNATNVLTALVLLPLALLTNLLGIWLVRRTPVDRYYAAIYILMFIVGLELIREGLTAILSQPP